MIYHNAAYDVKVLIYTLFMDDLLDTTGLLAGWNYLTRSFHDTKLMAYLCFNTTAELSLSLKNLAQSYAGNYAQDDEDIKDIRRIPKAELMEYNLIDACATFWLYNDYKDRLVKECQL